MILSLTEFKTLENITSTSDDAFLTAQLQLISDTVESYCRRKFEQATYVETFYRGDYIPTHTIRTFMYPIISVATLKQGLDVVLPADFRIHKPTGIITKPDAFFFYDDVEITYDAGFVTIPSEIRFVVQSLVKERYSKRQAGVDMSFGSDVQRVSIPGTISIDFDYSLQNNEKGNSYGLILGNYLNVVSNFRSDRAFLQEGRLRYVS